MPKLATKAPQRSAEELQERRLKRAEKRLKQRLENVESAQQMHKARLVSQKLPSLKKSRPKRVAGGSVQLHIGCSGWYYWHWKGLFYPADLASGKWFEHYMTNFETVELNAPFYSWPSLTSVRKWISQAKDQPMVYTVKVCELITHIKRFTGTKTLVKDFGFIADLLGDHMGCFLFQLPPSFHYTPGRLKAIIEQLDPKRRNVVEFRHASWWIKEVFDAFRKAGIIFCSCSGPRLPDQLVKTADDIYVRFHGTSKWYSHNYSADELQEWAKRIKASGAKRIWVYFNNDRNAYAIKNAQTLASYLRGKARK